VNKRRWQQPAGGSRQDFANDMRTRMKMTATSLTRGLFGTSQMNLVCPRGDGSRV
jgi:hypothetical protein